jgi:poly(ribitol-phosphate) beta-N-acetylglucosaminyltransferase
VPASNLQIDLTVSIDVTVVVPVYNPGRYIEACIEGYLSQTMPRDRREIIFVDDGSTDDTPERLDRLAAEHPDVRVIHQPNSGWPGKPRNVGIDAAAGDYVFFCDHDDWLGPQALERMIAMARRTGADVLVPKMVAHRRRAPRSIFRTNIDHAVIGQDPLMSSLTPHKLLRRGFLNDQGLRFPEGKRRLEDHVFVVEAFLTAQVISVLSDYPCYHRVRREDESNAAFQRWEADYYFRYVAEVIDVIDAHTEPGELRNTLLERPYLGEMMGKLTGKRLQRWDAESRQQIFDEVRALAIDRFPPGFHERFAIVPRAHAEALVANRLDLMTDVAKRTASPMVRTVLHDLSWAANGWVADIEAELRFADGSPILVTPSAEGWALDPRLIPADLNMGPYDIGRIVRGRADVQLRHHVNDVEWYAPANIRPELVKIDGDPHDAHRLVFRGTAVIDPATIAGGRPLAPGNWDVVLRMNAFGIFRVARVQDRARSASVLPPLALLLPATRIVTPRLSRAKQTLTFTVTKVARPRKPIIAAALLRARDAVVTSTGNLVATIDLAVESRAQPIECRVILTDGGAAVAQPQDGLTTIAVGPMLAGKLRYKPAPPVSRSQRASHAARRERRRLRRQLRRWSRRFRRLRRRAYRVYRRSRGR